MHQQDYLISSKKYPAYFDTDFSYLEKLVLKQNAIIITDENVAPNHTNKLIGWKSIVVRAGEEHKQQATIDYIIKELITLKADRDTFIIGVGGGVVTDMAGYAASVYMRGVKFAFVPTTILAMADAAIGGKNGIDVGLYKNLVGTINQPQFLLFDYSFLQTLSHEQFVNGFAEIIKHACIKDDHLFTFLEENTLSFFKSDTQKIDKLIKQNVTIKYNVVANDEFEKGDRKLLNFGHTIGHAIENIYSLPHGHAVSIGMAAACIISEKINNFSPAETEQIISLLKKYHLPVTINFDKEKVWEILILDKKKSGNYINFVLLNKIGNAVVKAVPLDQLREIFNNIQL